MESCSEDNGWDKIDSFILAESTSDRSMNRSQGFWCMFCYDSICVDLLCSQRRQFSLSGQNFRFHKIKPVQKEGIDNPATKSQRNKLFVLNLEVTFHSRKVTWEDLFLSKKGGGSEWSNSPSHLGAFCVHHSQSPSLNLCGVSVAKLQASNVAITIIAQNLFCWEESGLFCVN